ncbi:MAG TPA: alpha/beta fold hydrolase [Usitatibacter sp.]|nr:alpha/beta fold hydrolase [Usitatibacter sp.]
MLAICVAAAGLFAGAASAAQAPCTDAGASCTEMLALPGAQGGITVYRSYPLTKAEPAITRALVIVHGLLRDADSYFASGLAGALTAHALGDTIVVAPHFKSAEGSCKDTLAAGELGWHCQPRNDTWRTGGEAVEGGATSFDAVDELLRKLNDKRVFPNLKSIVVAGHSAGGQFVERYAMASAVHDSLAVKPTYVVMNPSSYAYLDEMRPTASLFAEHIEALPPGFHDAPPRRERADFARFRDAENCTTFDKWPYGLKERSGYVARIPDEQLKKQIVERPVTFLAGEYDILPLHGFDGSCAAMAQGGTRLARAYAFAKYLDERFGAKHGVHQVDGCGHSGRCMLGASESLKFLFPPI